MAKTTGFSANLKQWQILWLGVVILLFSTNGSNSNRIAPLAEAQQQQPPGKLRTRRAKGIGTGTSTIVQLHDMAEPPRRHRKRDNDAHLDGTIMTADNSEDKDSPHQKTIKKVANPKKPKPLQQVKPPPNMKLDDIVPIETPESPFLEKWNAGINNTDWLVNVSFGELDYLGHSGFWYARYPLGVCQGDCQTDDDCQVGLYCHQRVRYGAVPFCTGGETLNSTMDFCSWDTSYPPPAPPPKAPIGAFQIKLYWEKGYEWQGESVDRMWCMITDYDGYPGTGDCWYGDYPEECSFSQVYIGRCLEGDPRQWFTFVDLGTTYSKNDKHHEVLIRTVHDWCLYRHLSAIYLTPNCNPQDPKQRFFALSGSFTPNPDDSDGNRFEIGQYAGYTHDNCLTTAHHPKSGEVIEFHICDHSRRRGDETSYWELLF
ncbi:expressed unknown protein [Seminavis robusta]|uniref:Uncharacterized protein n=1 Tax=Seminavis robusta TaxID=568900 RepID=A0A9N8HU86_9STRA|nr:expressed unknown protein [Seminavis robusta]|eukprot:Sro2013_g310950.1 n/a (428) ;mRNA; f:5679-7689